MKHYPSITKDIRNDIYVYAFDKIDGSNIRAEWNSKRGFYKFGTKNQLMDQNSEPFGCAIKLIRDKYENDLSKIFNEQKWKDVICFFELWGPSSFAGSHVFSETLTVTLFDVNPYKQGILSPKKFIELFGHLDIPKVLYEGEVTKEFIDQVKQSTLPGMSGEGCVCKGINNYSKMTIMFKVKSKMWLNKLFKFCDGNEVLFNKLS